MKSEARNDLTEFYTTNPRKEELKPDRNPNSIAYNEQDDEKKWTHSNNIL